MFDRLLGRNPITSVSPQEAWNRISSASKKDAPVLIDVREEWEYRQGHARGAKNIPLGQLHQRLPEIPKDREVYVICQSGSRSSSATRTLLQEGYTQIINISGGTGMWRMQGLPLQ
jgi:rhodanese-related sulfurtransferase